MSLGAAELSLDVLKLPVAVAPCHQFQSLLLEMASLLWSHFRLIR